MFKSIDHDEVQDVISKYNQFAKSKSIVRINLQRLEELFRYNNLFISKVENKETNGLSSHFYLRSGDRIRLLYSLNETDRSKRTDQFINKFLHWWDIKYFKQNATATIYDFGGVSGDKSTANIDNFKRSFSTNYETSYKYWSVFS